MKHLSSLLGLTAALCLSVPATGWSGDRRGHSGHHHQQHCNSYSRHGSYGYSGHSYGRSYGYRPYSYSRYSPSYSSYPFGYSYPSYYARPSLGISFSTGPSFATYSRTVRSSDYSDDLAEDVQRSLARRGYYRGAIDGDVGPGTRGAIREYQYRNRLEVTGRIDRTLLRSLGLS